MQDIEKLLDNVTPEIYQRLEMAVETGKWPDGVMLTSAQKANSLQIVMLWQARNNHQAQHMTVGVGGQIVMKSKQELKQQFTQQKSIKIKQTDQ